MNLDGGKGRDRSLRWRGRKSSYTGGYPPLKEGAIGDKEGKGEENFIKKKEKKKYTKIVSQEVE